MKVRVRGVLIPVTTPAMREAKAAQAPIYTTENLNPRSRAVQVLYMSIKRGYLLIDLCSEWLHLCGGNQWTAITQPPFCSGYDSIKRKVKEVFAVEGEYQAARQYTETWPWLFGLWLKGSLERQLEEAALNLPSSLRTKVKA